MVVEFWCVFLSLDSKGREIGSIINPLASYSKDAGLFTLFQRRRGYYLLKLSQLLN
jgi:hypothetical protein